MTTAPTATSDRLSVEVAKNLMNATIHLRATEEPGPPTPEEVVTALEKEQIHLDDTVRSCVEEFLRLVSAGKAPGEPFLEVRKVPYSKSSGHIVHVILIAQGACIILAFAKNRRLAIFSVYIKPAQGSCSCCVLLFPATQGPAVASCNMLYCLKRQSRKV